LLAGCLEVNRSITACNSLLGILFSLD